MSVPDVQEPFLRDTGGHVCPAVISRYMFHFLRLSGLRIQPRNMMIARQGYQKGNIYPVFRLFFGGHPFPGTQEIPFPES